VGGWLLIIPNKNPNKRERDASLVSFGVLFVCLSLQGCAVAIPRSATLQHCNAHLNPAQLFGV
jgi:hypothetical protein